MFPQLTLDSFANHLESVYQCFVLSSTRVWEGCLRPNRIRTRCGVNCTGNTTKQDDSPQQPRSRKSCGPDKHKALSSEWSPPLSRTNNTGSFNSLVKNCHSSRRMFWNERSSPLYNDIIDQDISLSALNRTILSSNQDKNDSLSTRVTPTRSHALGDMDTMENYWFMAGDQETCSGFELSNQHLLDERRLVGNDSNLALDCSIERRILQERKRSPDPSISALPPTPPGSPLTQHLEQSHSPVNKLERLKERIRRQRNLDKMKGTLSNRPHAEQPVPALKMKFGDTFNNGSMKHWVRKMTFAPPAPAYKGFNAVELAPDKKFSRSQEFGEAIAVKSWSSQQQMMRRRDWGRQNTEQKRNSLKASIKNWEANLQAQRPSKSPSPKRTIKSEESHTSGIFAWREGQKLVRMLLGPPQKCPNVLTKALDHEDRNDFDTSADQQARDPEEHNPTISHERSPRRRLCITKQGDHSYTSVKTGLSDSDQPISDVLPWTRTLDDLESEKDIGKNQSSTLKMGSGSPTLEREHGECSHRHPTGHGYHFCHKDKSSRANLGHTSPVRCCNPRLGSCPSSKRSLSPLKNRLSPNHPGTGNQEGGEVGPEELLRSPQTRNYNADEVREYMNRQLVERKKKEREEKHSVKHAMEMRKKRLQEVYRKQKEALSKKMRGKPRSSSLAAGQTSTRQEMRVGAAHAIKDQAAAQANTDPEDFQESGMYQQELNDTKRPFHHYLSSKYSPLRLQDLESHRRCQDRSSPPVQLSWFIGEPLPLAHCEGVMSCKASGVGSKDRQQRIDAICSMATALNGRIENEARRLAMETDVWKRPGSPGRDEGRERAGLGGFTHSVASLTDCSDLKQRHVPSPEPAPSPRASLSDFKVSPALRQEWGEQQGVAAPEDKMVDKKPALQDDHPEDSLLGSSSSQSESNVPWTDLESLAEHGLCSKPRGIYNLPTGKPEEMVNKCTGVQRFFNELDHQATRKVKSHELPFETVLSENRSPSGRTSWEMSGVQDANNLSQAQKSQRLGSDWSPSRTASGSKQMDKRKDSGYHHDLRCQPNASDCLEMRKDFSLTGKSHRKKRQLQDPQQLCLAIVEENYNLVSTPFPRSSAISSTLDTRSLNRSGISTSSRKTSTNDLGKRKKDPVTQRLPEMMNELQEESEQLRFHSKAHSSLKENSSLELKASPRMTPVITETTNCLRSNTKRRVDVDISLDRKESVLGSTHTSFADGMLVKDTLVEQSFWSLLPSESHWRRTMESKKKSQPGDEFVQNAMDGPFGKWQESGTSIFGSQDAFSRFTLEMAQQYLKEEEVRARHQAALFRLRERALREKTQAELAWLEHQKTHLRDKGQDDKMPAIIQKQREILMKLQQEKAEIRHLQNVYKAAHQERKLLLKQQQEIFRIHQTTAHLQCQLDRSAMDPQVLGSRDILLDSAVVSHSEGSASPEFSPRIPDLDEWSCSSLSASGSEDSIAMKQLKKMHSRLDERFLTKKEKELIKRRRQAEDLLEWKQRCDAEELAVHRTESGTVAPCSPLAQEIDPGKTETDNWNSEECSHSTESNKSLCADEVVTLAAVAPSDEHCQGQQTVKSPAESWDQRTAIVLKPLEKSAIEMAKTQTEKGLLITEAAQELDAGENQRSPLRCELANGKAMLVDLQTEQKRRRRERLKMEEADLCRQLEEYDAFITKTQAELMSDAEFYLISKPQIKAPIAALHKPFPQLLRSTILKYPAKPSAEILQSQNLPSKRGEKYNGVEEISKQQEIIGSVHASCPLSKSQISDQPSQYPVSQLLPSSVPDDGNLCVESQLEMLTHCGSAESSRSSDIVIESSDSSDNCKEEILSYSKLDNSACKRTKDTDNTLTEKSSILLETDGNEMILSSKPAGSLFGRNPQLQLHDAWIDIAPQAADNLLQASAHNLLSNTISLEAEERLEHENMQPDCVVKNSEGTKHWFALPNHSRKVFASGAPASFQTSSQVPMAQSEMVKPEIEVDFEEGTAAGLFLQKEDNFWEPTATPPSLRSRLDLNKSAALASSQMAPAIGCWTAEIISPVLPLPFLNGFANTEENSKGQVLGPLSNEVMHSPANGTLCTNGNMLSSLEQANPLRSETVEEMALHRVGGSPGSDDIASKSDALLPLNAKQKSEMLPPVLKEEDLVSLKGISLLALGEQPSPVEEISPINEELLSSIEEDSIFNTRELSSPIYELMLCESETFLIPDEIDIAVETKNVPPSLEENIFLVSNKLPSSIRENTFDRTEGLQPPSVGNSSLNEELPPLSEKDSVMNADDFTTLLPPPIEALEEEKVDAMNDKLKHPLKISGEETGTQLDEENIFSESLRIHILQTDQQVADPIKNNHVGDQMQVSHGESDTLRCERSFDQGCCAGVEGDRDEVFRGGMCFEYMNNFDGFNAPGNPWADYEFDTVVTSDKDCDAVYDQNYQKLDNQLKEAHGFEEISEEKGNEKQNTSQLKVKKPISCHLGQGDIDPGSLDKPALEQIILECAKSVESFVDCQDLLDAEVERELHLDFHVNVGDLDHPQILQHPRGKGSEQLVNEVTEHLTEYLGEETLDKVTGISGQQNQSSKEMKGTKLDGHQNTQDCLKFAQQSSSPLKGQRDHDKYIISVPNLSKTNCIQLKDPIRIAKEGCHEESIENVTENLIEKLVDDAAKEYTQIKSKHRGKLDANNILCPQATVNWASLDETFNTDIFEGSQDVSCEKCKGFQPFPDSKTPGQRFALDRWCSGIRRKPKEAIFAVPYNLMDVQQWVDKAINVLWNQCCRVQDNMINVSENREQTDEKDGDAESKGVHKQVIFDLTSDLFQNLLMKEPMSKSYSWLTHKSWAGLLSGCVPDTQQQRQMKSFIQRQVAKLLNLDRNDLEMREKLQQLTKYCKSKRDRVDIILIQELQEEESQWVEYTDDELTVKMKLTEDIFNILVHDTVGVLNTICDRGSARHSVTISSM
ncbi:centrosome-associated protein 350-like isoform X2 [Chiloscyllium plagiosum]|uniref:centrosome-associated protein 350-like isoform X2 n=1 Tax=Chiloscyllium plagiosum TaxID=36176 RepID=UPI001CB7CBEF|nr:centrosome-associated protein 350-like isoform X2 [Chiloscyllium plagiosum]